MCKFWSFMSRRGILTLTTLTPRQLARNNPCIISHLTQKPTLRALEGLFDSRLGLGVASACSSQTVAEAAVSAHVAGMTFVAVIRRVPGGSYLKAPKSHRFPAVPIQTSLRNLHTYFVTWPKCQAQFLLYGPRRPCCTSCVPSKALQPKPLRALDLQSRRGSTAAHLYGPLAHSADAVAAKQLGLAGLLRRFRRKERLAMITAYDFPSARLARCASVDLVLVGDSLGNSLGIVCVCVCWGCRFCIVCVWWGGFRGGIGAGHIWRRPGLFGGGGWDASNWTRIAFSGCRRLKCSGVKVCVGARALNFARWSDFPSRLVDLGDAGQC